MPSPSASSDRVAAAAAVTFASAFGSPPAAVAAAPGRVNLIGEHIDYLGLPVLPMALQRGIRLAYRPRGDGRVHVVNADGRFGEVRFEVGPDIVPAEPGSWGNYVRAAARTLALHLGLSRGLDGAVASDLPVAAGLSSSSALVVAVAVALLRAHQLDIEPAELMEALAAGERYVGLEGGGMDQAICLGGRRGHAARVDFAPLRLGLVPLPEAWRIVVASSGTEAPKSATVRDAYNRRAAGARRAVRTVAAAVDEVGTPARDLLRRHGLDELLGAGRSRLDAVLYRRLRHVLGEALRVEGAVEALEAADAASFGRLMLSSHGSLRDDYEVSTPRLDELVGIATDAGAAGARLTGAGFGGCIVALTDRAGSRPLIHALDDAFYRPRGMAADLDGLRFEAHAADGALAAS